MPNDFFQFIQFTVKQNHCAMKVGTDGVLLGAWTTIGFAKRILDIGTGTGLLALMLAQRSDAQIDAIEIDSDASSQARENVHNSPWSKRISIFSVSLQEFVKEKKKYDLIITNPPFFSNALKAPDKKRSMARHNHLLSQTLLTESVNTLLKPDGRFCLILPSADFISFTQQMNKIHLHLTRQTNIYSKPDSPCIRILAEFSRKESEVINEDFVIALAGRHQYSTQYIELTKAFYLKF